METIDDSFLLRNLQDKEKTEENDKTTSEENIIKPTALRMEKKSTNNNILKYNPNVNYYEEYWKMVCDNEYLAVFRFVEIIAKRLISIIS